EVVRAGGACGRGGAALARVRKLRPVRRLRSAWRALPRSGRGVREWRLTGARVEVSPNASSASTPLEAGRGRACGGREAQESRGEALAQSARAAARAALASDCDPVPARVRRRDGL